MDKSKRYNKVSSELSSYFDGYILSRVARMSIIASSLANIFPEWIFCGFYRVSNESVLEIGPYQSTIIPCGNIKFSHGVCGKSAREEKSVIVGNVNNFDGYISCDDQTVSEIVIPVFSKNKLIAVLDIDGGEENQFDEIDQKFLETIVEQLK